MSVTTTCLKKSVSISTSLRALNCVHRSSSLNPHSASESSGEDKDIQLKQHRDSVSLSMGISKPDDVQVCQ